MKIGIASDHRGYTMKTQIIKYLSKKNFQVYDFGTNSTDSVDYPKYAFKLGEAVSRGDVDFGIIMCGTGIGISIACNKVRGIRCAKVDNVKEARLTRLDNDANVVSLNGSMPLYRAKDIIDVFLSTNFSGGERHLKRIKMIHDYENDNNIIKRRVKEERENNGEDNEVAKKKSDKEKVAEEEKNVE